MTFARFCIMFLLNHNAHIWQVEPCSMHLIWQLVCFIEHKHTHNINRNILFNHMDNWCVTYCAARILSLVQTINLGQYVTSVFKWLFDVMIVICNTEYYLHYQEVSAHDGWILACGFHFILWSSVQGVTNITLFICLWGWTVIGKSF